jgi:hypothetical protein
MKRIMILLPAVFGFSLVSVREASACSIGNCGPPVRLFHPDHHVAANLIRFKITAADPGPLELRAADGTVVPARISTIGPDRVFGPDAPPAEGQKLTLHYRPVCFYPAPPGATPNPTEATFSFVVSPAGEMELGPSTLTMTEKGIAHSGDARSLIVRFSHELPDRSWNARHLTDTTWTIAGRPMAFSYPDSVVSHCTPPRADWSPNSCGSYGAVPPGKHLLKAVSRIVGLDREFVAELEVDTSCDQVLRIDPYVPPEGGRDAGSLDAGGHDAGSHDAGVPPPITDALPADGPGADVRPAEATVVLRGTDRAACSVSGLGGPGRVQAAGGSLALLLAALGWVARRRSRP